MTEHDYGKNLEAAINAKGLTKAAFGRAIGESGQVVNGWIRRNGVPPAKAPRASKVLGVDQHTISHFQSDLPPKEKKRGSVELAQILEGLHRQYEDLNEEDGEDLLDALRILQRQIGR